MPQFAEVATMQQACCDVQPTHTQTTPPSECPPEPLSGPPEELLEAPLDDDEVPLEEEDMPLDDPLEELPPLLELELEPDLHGSRQASAMQASSESPSPFSLAV